MDTSVAFVVTYLDGVLGEVESLLNYGCELTNATALLAKDRLCPGGQDDDLRLVRRHADFDARVAVFGELAAKELVQLSLEDAVGDELALLGHCGGHVGGRKRERFKRTVTIYEN